MPWNLALVKCWLLDITQSGRERLFGTLKPGVEGRSAMMRRLTAELLAFLAAFLFTVSAGGLVIGAAANVSWPLLFLVGCLIYYVLRPWMRDVLSVPVKAKR
jgi:hypothetical protein